MTKKVAIVGAGPCGILLAHYLLRRGDRYQIDIYERRSDPRFVEYSQRRTYPLSLSDRGMSAMRSIEGLEEAVREISVEMRGSAFHQTSGKTRYRPRNNPLVTLDRTELVIVMLDKLIEQYDSSRVKLHCDRKCTGVDWEAKTIECENVADDIPPGEEKITASYDLLIGADGARSTVRTHFLKTKLFEYEQKYVDKDYKSLFLPSPEKAGIDLKPDQVHGWRLDDGTTLLLLRQKDGTMGGVIHFPRENNQVVGLSSAQEVLQFFQDKFPKVGQLMEEAEAEAFLKRPLGRVLTVRCNRYHHGDSVLILGDAAHALSPSIGQGCNAALEDVVIFDSLLDEYSDNLALALEQFTLRRYADASALVELGDYAFPTSTRLFIEFLLRERIDKFMHSLFPKQFPPALFDLISETKTPYSEILQLKQGWIKRVKKAERGILKTI